MEVHTVGRHDDALAAALELEASSDPRFQSYGRLAQMILDLYSGRFDATLAESRVAPRPGKYRRPRGRDTALP